MPIRMDKDDDSNEGYSGNQSTERGGGGFNSGGSGGLGNIIGFLLPLLIRYPKLLIVVLIVAGGYFFVGKGCSGPAAHQQQSNAYAKGAVLDKEVYDKNEVYAALDNGEPLPDKVNLEKFAPDAQDQGQQGSCVGWGSTYCGRTVLEAVRTGKNPNDIAFSPAFTYNQIGEQDCQGTLITKAVDLLTNEGALPYNSFPYTDQSCSKQPNDALLQQASSFKMKGANRLTLNSDDYTVDLNALRQNLAQGSPVIIGMSVGGSFMQDMMGKEYWQPTQDDYNRNGFGGHCMCVIGYDDKYFDNDGAVLIQNSWGPKWGKNGRAWVSYKDFVYFGSESYGIDAMPSEQDQKKLSCSLALVDKESKQEISLTKKQTNVFECSSPLKIGKKFKVKLTNSIECYIYIFGKESDNTSYILFPYTPKHSAYCGITGTRIFPRDYSMEVDKIGNRDIIGIVISKQRLDFKALNDKLTADKSIDFNTRFFNLFKDQTIEHVTYKNTDNISFDAQTDDKNILPIIIEIPKN